MGFLPLKFLGFCTRILGFFKNARASPRFVASVLKVEFSGGEVLTYGPGPRAALMDRVRELAVIGAAGATFSIDGEPVDVSSFVPAPPPVERAATEQPEAREHKAEREAALNQKAAAPEPEAPPQPDREPEAERPALTLDAGGERLDLDEAARLSEQFLRNGVALSERMIDRAAERGLEALERLAAMQAKQAEAQQRHTEALMAQAAQLQGFVGSMVATVAEERLAAVRIRSADKQMSEVEALRAASRDVQLAKINAERDIHLAQLNRPSPVGVLLEFAATFAAQYAQNAAANFAHMNDFKQPGETN